MARRTAARAGDGSRWSLAATASLRACQSAGNRSVDGATVALAERATVAGAAPTAAVAGAMEPSARVRPVPTTADQRMHFFKNGLLPVVPVRLPQGRRDVAAP